MFKIKKMAAMLCAMMLALTAVSADSIKPNSCKGPTLCNSFPIYDGCGWHFEVGLILEQVRISNTDLCFIQTRGGAGTLDSPTISRDPQNLNFNIDPGLRLGVGKYFKHDDWMLNINFEWLNTTGSLKLDVTSDGNTAIVPIAVTRWAGEEHILQPDLGAGLNLQQMEASLAVNYFLLDVYLSRGSYFSGNFTYEPLAGLKVSWIHYGGRQVYQEDVNGYLPSTNSLLRTISTDFWGVGPMIGMNGNYHVCAGWSFFSTTNFSVLLGESKITEREGVVTTEKQPVTERIRDTIIVLSPTLRNIIGLQYDRDIYCDKQHYSLKFGFDARYYFNQHPIVEKYASFAFGTAVATDDAVLMSAPNVSENNSFGMVGFLLDFGWDF